jgi:hypothetical protein
MRNNKPHFEPSNQNLLESGFDGQLMQIYVVQPVANPINYNEQEPFDMDDFSDDDVVEENNNECEKLDINEIIIAMNLKK